MTQLKKCMKKCIIIDDCIKMIIILFVSILLKNPEKNRTNKMDYRMKYSMESHARMDTFHETYKGNYDLSEDDKNNLKLAMLEDGMDPESRYFNEPGLYTSVPTLSNVIYVLLESGLEPIKTLKVCDEIHSEKCYEKQSINIGTHEIRGRRYSMEDVTLTKKTKLLNRDCTIVAIFDGHGGITVAYRVSEILLDELNKAHQKLLNNDDNDNFEETLKQVIENAFMNIDDILKKYAGWECGSTANVCFLFDDLIVCANIGDTRAVLFKINSHNNSLEGVDLSRDHKPNDPIEKERIIKAGSRVEFWSRAWRVDTLAVARAFGDFTLKLKPKLSPRDQPVTAFPDITFTKRSSSDKYLIIGCDGLWDVLNNDIIKTEIEKWVSEEKSDVKDLAKRLVDLAYVMVSGDNISCVVVKL